MVRKRPKYDKTKAVKAIARERVGAPKASRAIKERPLRPKPKHKKRWTEEE
jgi:hypothetical protein